MVRTPILFQTFARADYARQVWDAIKASKPDIIYFYSNKARSERYEEVKNNEIIRAFINEIDWECKLHTWFRDEYVDVYTSLKSSVDWICENEDEWIVLEEDVIPTHAFFHFCDQMLDYYRYDYRVWNVSGDNFWNLSPQGYDYLFSNYHWMYGWATWKSRWRAINWDKVRIDEMLEQDIYRHLYKSKSQYLARIEERKSNKSFIETTKCWDYMFGLACEQNNAVQVIPAYHLVTNIGISGVHHKKAQISFVNRSCKYTSSTYEITKRPPFVFADYEYDYLIYKNAEKEYRSWFKRILYVFVDLLHIRGLLHSVKSTKLYKLFRHR